MPTLNLNIMNEWYVRDTSRKIKSVLHARGMDAAKFLQKKLSEQKRNNELNQLIKKIYEDNVSGNMIERHITAYWKFWYFYAALPQIIPQIRTVRRFAVPRAFDIKNSICYTAYITDERVIS